MKQIRLELLGRVPQLCEAETDIWPPARHFRAAPAAIAHAGKTGAAHVTGPSLVRIRDQHRRRHNNN